MIKNSTEFLGNMESTRKELGLSVNQAAELAPTIASANIQGLFLGLTASETADAFKAINKESGNLKFLTAEVFYLLLKFFTL